MPLSPLLLGVLLLGALYRRASGPGLLAFISALRTRRPAAVEEEALLRSGVRAAGRRPGRSRTRRHRPLHQQPRRVQAEPSGPAL